MSPYERYIVNENLAYSALKMQFKALADDEDIRQEARLALWEACISFDESRAAFSTFAYLMVRCRIMKLLRKNRAKMRMADIISLQTPVSDDGITLEGTLMGDEDVCFTDLGGFLGQLCDRDRQIVQMRLGGMTIQQIGERIGISKQAVSQRLEKLKGIFRGYIQG